MRRFLQLLIENQQVPMKDQEHVFKKIFLEWKGSLEQIDDVMVMGIQI